MSSEELNLAAFRQRLLDLQQSLRKMADSSAESTLPVELDQTRVGRVSRMDALQQQAMAQETARRRELELQRIKSALIRIDNDNFGYCIGCDELIDKQRLEIEPTLLHCIDCAKKAEQRN
jgi:DnaK suppressor protein